MRHAFSLVELSIVLVILGLLTGGILAGQSLIRASELRAVTTEYQRYITAVRTFRDKYMSLPGDIRNATAFWGKDNTNCSGHTGTTAVPGTCNGDGDGLVESGTVIGGIGEDFMFWQHLANAGLIEGSYTGLSGTTLWDALIGTNVPASKISNVGWTANSYRVTANPAWIVSDFVNKLWVGVDYPTMFTTTVFLKPEEAWNIDTKMDDGMPIRGLIRVPQWGANCTNAVSQASTDATYLLTTSSNACALVFDNNGNGLF